MPPQLVALTEGPNILLDKPILLLGRHQECDIQLGSRKISRRHCCVAQVHDYLVVRDLGSTNGIRINGIRVVEGSLRPGDELTIGNVRYEVQWNAKAGEALPSAKLPAPEKQKAPRPPLPPAPAADDARLEAADEPVALSESLPGNVGTQGVLAGLPANSPPPDTGYQPQPQSGVMVVPEDIKLAPLSDEKRNGNAK